MRWFLLSLILAGALHAQTFTDPNFTVDWLATPGFGTIALDFDASGRLYVTEKQGRIHVLTPDGSGGYNAPTLFADLTSFIYDSSESGLLGLALDPDYITNRYIYIFYTTPGDQRLVRIQANTNFLTWTTTQTDLLTGLPRAAGNHKAGDIDFHPNDPNNIYITLGDDAVISLSNDLDQYHGKILRVNKTNGQGLTDNPFYTSSTTSIRSRIWAYGFRNPFRFCFHPNAPVPNTMYTSENGGPGGVTLQDRLCFTQRGCDGAWNTANSQAGTNSPYYSPSNPVGSECLLLYRDQSSHIGVDIVQGGPFGDPANPSDSVIYLSNWLQAGGSIRRWRLTGANLDSITPLAIDGGNRFVTSLYATDMKFGPDGWMYFTQSGNGVSSGSSYRIGRIRRTGNQPPVASFTTSPSPATGPAPFNVQFTDTSTDFDGTITAWSWNFGDGNNSTQQNPSHIYTATGNFTVTLTVTDSGAAQDSETAPVTVNIPAPPVASFTTNPSPAVGQAPFNVQFTDTSTDSDGVVVAWQWNFGDGNFSTQQHPAHTYIAAGNYTVVLTVTDSQTLQDQDQGSVQATVQAPPVASFTTSPSPATGTAPLNVQFTDTSTDSDGTIVAWSWDFGDGNSSTQQSPAHTYTATGVFTAILTVTDSDTLQDSEQATITVRVPPEAAFTTVPMTPTGQAPLFVQFMDASTDSDGTITAWAWDFGDGDTANQPVTSHVYDTAGSFTVALTVTDNDGLQDSAQITVTVEPESDGGGGDEDESGCAVGGTAAIGLLLLIAIAAATLARRRRSR